MADDNFLQALRLIDDKIATWQKARDQLAKALGIDDSAAASMAKAVPCPVTTAQNPAQPSSNGNRTPSGRKVQLAKFLAANGPTLRATIIDQAGLPEGTISYCLNDKRFFYQSPDGNWHITEYSRRGLERGHKNGTFESEPH
jgi:hypothetical protein